MLRLSLSVGLVRVNWVMYELDGGLVLVSPVGLGP